VEVNVMEQPGWQEVLGAVARSIGETVRLALGGEIRSPKDRVGMVVTFPEGVRSEVFRETRVVERSFRLPAVLVVEFRPRGIGPRPRLLHAMFRTGCVVNTLLFAGFPGFGTKLWMADRGTGGYRGLYEWYGADLAHAYASTLTRILTPVSAPGSVRYRVIPGQQLDDYLRLLDRGRPDPKPMAKVG
jgi:hypothetical protein